MFCDRHSGISIILYARSTVVLVEIHTLLFDYSRLKITFFERMIIMSTTNLPPVATAGDSPVIQAVVPFNVLFSKSVKPSTGLKQTLGGPQIHKSSEQNSQSSERCTVVFQRLHDWETTSWSISVPAGKRKATKYIACC